MRIVTLLMLIGLSLTGCDRAQPLSNAFDPEAAAKAQAAKERAADTRAVDAGFAPAQPGPLQTVSVDPVKTEQPGSILPPATSQYRYLGAWAATPALCASNAWRFQLHKLAAAGDQSCDYPTVAAAPAGYQLQGECRAAGRRIAQTVRLNFDERRRTMHVEGASIGPADLIYCGE